MMEAWLSSDSEAVDLLAGLPEKVGALRIAHADGARFLAVPVRENRAAAEWALACFHSPITFVPLPPELGAAALARQLGQLPPGEVIFPELLKRGPQVSEPPLREKSEVWAVIFTSGTTGEPKGVALSGAALEASALVHAIHSGAAQVTWLLDLPLFHVGGLSVLTRAFFLNAGVALSAPHFSALETARWIRKGRVGGLSLVPTTLLRLLREPILDLSALSLILLGGAPASAEIVAQARERNAPLRLTYGMTENSSQVATERSIGGGLEPLPGVDIKISNEDEILFRSSSLASGYFQKGRLEPLPLRGGFFPTGDLGEISGGKLVIHGRRSELIISGGKKIYPAELEAALTKLSGIADCAVLGLPDVEWGEALCAAIVEMSPGAFGAERTKAELRKTFESHQIPKRWAVLAAIPRSSSGKVLRPELKRAFELAQTQS